MAKEHTMHAINRPTRVQQVLVLHRQTLPRLLAIIAIVIAANFLLMLGIAIALEGEGTVTTGSAPIILGIFVMITAILSITQYLPLALGLGASRSDFFLASLLQSVFLSITLAVSVGLLAAIESATDGWGLEYRFFDIAGLASLHPLVMNILVALALLAVACLGMLFGAVHVRWGAPGTWTAITAAVALAGAVGYAAGRASRALGSLPLEASLLGGTALAAIAFAGLTRIVLRRASV